MVTVGAVAGVMAGMTGGMMRRRTVVAVLATGRGACAGRAGMRRRTVVAMFAAALMVVPVVAPPVSAQESSDALVMKLLDEVHQLRAEVSGIRNENEMLRHRLEALLDQLGMEVKEPTVRTVITAPSTQPVAAGTPAGGQTRPASPMKPADQPTGVEPPAEETATGTPPADQRTAGGQTRPASPMKPADQPTGVEPPAEETATGTPPADQRTAAGQVAGSSARVDAPVARAPRSDSQSLALSGRRAPGSEQEREAYLDALAYLDKDQYDGLRAALQQFLGAYPGSPYEPKARYWIAESYYTEKQYSEAAWHFEQYVKRFPRGDKADDARLKLAYIYHGEGDPAAARLLLESLADSHNGRVRDLAKRRLRIINRESAR